MCYGSQDGLAALALVLPRTQRGAQSPLDHRVHRLHLPPLPILPLVSAESLLHPPPPAPRRRLFGRPPALGRDDCPNAARPDAAVDPLGVEVRVGQQRSDPGTTKGLPQRHAELHQVRTRPSTGYCGEDHVAAAIDHEDDLRVLGVSRDLVAISAAGATLDIVPAGVPRLQPGTIDRGQRNTPLPDPVP